MKVWFGCQVKDFARVYLEILVIGTKMRSSSLTSQIESSPTWILWSTTSTHQLDHWILSASEPLKKKKKWRVIIGYFMCIWSILKCLIHRIYIGVCCFQQIQGLLGYLPLRSSSTHGTTSPCNWFDSGCCQIHLFQQSDVWSSTSTFLADRS